jgi:hypothetical protein
MIRLTPLKEMLYRHNAEKAESKHYAERSVLLYIALKQREAAENERR